ncbi:hypothetical protein Daesc_007756 [Daldinia eschscholtzii]|uniref:Uncharacterized protein n=1 Tax=Daldinia eschscholtzii TaxID=292717 RepID=A0AAX6MF39_9PEZI
MDYLRSNVLRRGQSSDPQRQDLERGRPEMGEQSGSRTRRFPISRPSLPAIFTNRSLIGGQNQRTGDGNAEDDSPKTPHHGSGFPHTPSTHLRIPNSGRAGAGEFLSPTSSQTSAPTSQVYPPRTQDEQFPTVSEPRPSHRSDDRRDNSLGRPPFRGADPGETRLADQVGRTRRNRRRRERHDGRPKRFHTDVAFADLALSITKNVNSNEFTVLLIVVILSATIFFCHGLVRICMLIIKPPNEDERPRIPQLMEPGGYAVPRRPIHVILARDEEAAGIDNVANKLEPPAYGLWRESVRVDPDRLYWQRNDQAPTDVDEEQQTLPETAHTRPPSYASEDGVSYVVEARPRSMAPLTDVPLTPHPSESRLPPATERP